MMDNGADMIFGHWSVFWPLWWFPFHGLVTAFFVIAMIVLVVLLFRRRADGPVMAPPALGSSPVPTPPPAFTSAPPGAPPRSDALAIVEARYARGEIQRDEYLQKKQDLGG